MEGKNDDDVDEFFVAFIAKRRRHTLLEATPRKKGSMAARGGAEGHYEFKALNHRLMEDRGMYFNKIASAIKMLLALSVDEIRLNCTLFC